MNILSFPITLKEDFQALACNLKSLVPTIFNFMFVRGNGNGFGLFRRINMWKNLRHFTFDSKNIWVILASYLALLKWNVNIRSFDIVNEKVFMKVLWRDLALHVDIFSKSMVEHEQIDIFGAWSQISGITPHPPPSCQSASKIHVLYLSGEKVTKKIYFHCHAPSWYFLI